MNDPNKYAVLNDFMPRGQIKTCLNAMKGEEKAHFVEILDDMVNRTETMPGPYKSIQPVQDAIVHLHYFRGEMDWYIVEKDSSREQLQAYGRADLGYGPEWGYICIQELIENGVELDLYFTPCKVSEL